MSTRIARLKLLIKEQGFLFALKYYFLRVTNQQEKYIRFLYDFFKKYLSEEIEKYKNLNVEKTDSEVTMQKRYVWVCWWQGYENMPRLCKACYEQLKSVLDEKRYELILITKNNYSDYAVIPDYIIEKLERGYIKITQFSDILRISLLYNHGGMWLDASVWCTDKINDYLSTDKDFWSVKLKTIDDKTVLGQCISECKWCGFLLGGRKPGGTIYRFVFEAMCKYYKEYSFTLDYFIQNMIIKVAYENIDIIQENINNVEESNSHIYDLYRHMDEPFDSGLWDLLQEDTCFLNSLKKENIN